jgi:glucan 1,3-beta-glucosidase
MKSTQLRGVNLGGWLTIEKWITPSLFANTEAEDEYNLATELGDKKYDLFKKHRAAFVTKRDIAWIARQGLNAVRLPVGYQLFEATGPYVASGKYVDKLMKWAKEYKLRVIIDLHHAPGSQNGFVHSGQIGEPRWHLDPQNISKTIEVIEQIAGRWGKHPSLYGIELLNEPHWDIPLSVLQDFYMRAYGKARKLCHERVAIIMSDAYRPLAEWDEFLKQRKFKNVLLDMHLYQVFTDKDKALDLAGHLAKAIKWKQMLQDFGPGRILVGEWSTVIDNIYDKLSPEDARMAKNLYMDAQKYAFNQTAGWFYWNYKTEAMNDDWNFHSLSRTLQ